MTGGKTARMDWRALWASGDLARFTFDLLAQDNKFVNSVKDG